MDTNKPNTPPQEIAPTPIETTEVNGQIYEIEKLRVLAERIPVKEISLHELREPVSDGHYYWIDRDGEKLGPFQILTDWEKAQHNEAWADHVASIKRANLENPIWMSKDGHVFDGAHRLTRAFLENKPTVKVQIFDEFI